MALDNFKYNRAMPLHFKGLSSMFPLIRLFLLLAALTSASYVSFALRLAAVEHMFSSVNDCIRRSTSRTLSLRWMIEALWH